MVDADETDVSVDGFLKNKDPHSLMWIAGGNLMLDFHEVCVSHNLTQKLDKTHTTAVQMSRQKMQHAIAPLVKSIKEGLKCRPVQGRKAVRIGSRTELTSEPDGCHLEAFGELGEVIMQCRDGRGCGGRGTA